MRRCLFRALAFFVLVVSPARSATLVVSPDGTGDAPTIQEAIDVAAEGDTVLLETGSFHGDGNRDIRFGGRNIVVRSRTGSPESCSIDCEGTDEDYHRGFVFDAGEGPGAVIEGLTVRNANLGPLLPGGGVLVVGASPTIRNCRFVQNRARTGGALHFEGSGSVVEGTTIEGNYGLIAGSAAYVGPGSQVRFERCVFFQNDTPYHWGGDVYSDGLGQDGMKPGAAEIELVRCTLADNFGSAVLMAVDGGAISTYRTIIAMNDGAAAWCTTGLIECACTDIYGNHTDWLGCLDGQQWGSDNLSADPLFCSLFLGRLSLQPDSPCLAENSPCGLLIGAVDAECASGDGACCNRTSGQCLVTTQGVCAAGGPDWEFLGYFTVCEPNPCPAANGACCLPDSACIITTEEDCGANSGEYQGAMSECDPDPCSTADAAAFGPSVPSLSLSSFEPNPASSHVEFAIELAEEGRVVVDVFDVSGASVVEVLDAHLGAGRHEVKWSPRGRDGNMLAVGTYFLQVTAKANTVSRRVTVVR